MTPDANDAVAAAADSAAVKRVTVGEARALIDAGRGVLVDTRSRNLYDNAHAAGAISLPLSEIEATNGHVSRDSVPPDGVLILYCA